MTYQRSSKLAQLASVLAPVLLIVAMRVLLSPGPSQASAASSPAANHSPAPAPTASQPVAAALTAEQQRASDWRHSLKVEAGLNSPMDREMDIVLLPKKEPLPPPPPAPVPKMNPVEGLALTGVLGDQRQSIVAISGKVYRVGDRVKNKLTVTAVDSRRLSVTLTDDEGVEYVLKKDK